MRGSIVPPLVFHRSICLPSKSLLRDTFGKVTSNFHFCAASEVRQVAKCLSGSTCQRGLPPVCSLHSYNQNQICYAFGTFAAGLRMDRLRMFEVA